MVTSFDNNVAKEFGIDNAIIIHLIHFFVWQNNKVGRNVSDGKVWECFTIAALRSFLPFWTESKIASILHQLAYDGLIFTQNIVNEHGENTMWFALSDKVTDAYGDMEVRHG